MFKKIIDSLFNSATDKQHILIHWPLIGKTGWKRISTQKKKPDGTQFNHYNFKFSCTSQWKFWGLPDISMTETDEEEENEANNKTYKVPIKLIQYERKKLLEMRSFPLSLMRPLNLPELDCVQTYHSE